jgi:hypothetical protein
MRVVPSQVREVMRLLFPDLEREPAQVGQHGLYRGNDIRAILDLVERIPDELIQLWPDESALYLANVRALHNEWTDRNTSNNQLAVRPLGRGEHTSLFEVRRLLAKCPDEAAALATTGFEFIQDVDFRNLLRADLGAANADLVNHHYKASTVLAGSVVEALLLWGLERLGETNVRTAYLKAPKGFLNDWTLAPLIAAAEACQLITSETKRQAELAQNYRNLIHPGRQARLDQQCDRGTALAALAAVELIAVDLKRQNVP